MTRRIPYYMAAYTPEDVEEFAANLADLMQQHEAETDPAWRDALAWHIADDARWLAEMREAVFPSLPFRLPNGLPAPRPVREVGR
jgi:cytosine/adenosine deaminase-related metal-dependent hydrolase